MGEVLPMRYDFNDAPRQQGDILDQALAQQHGAPSRPHPRPRAR
jgi:hypothetical protein